MNESKQMRITPYGCVIAVGAVVLLCLCLCDLGKYSMIHIIPDEFGYWATGAFFAGFDWSDIAFQDAYYSYGYGVLLAPIVKLFTKPAVLYRVAIGLNALLLQGIYGLTIYFLRNMFSKLNKYAGVAFAFVTTCYVTNMVYVRVAWPEVFLVFLYWLMCGILFAFIKKSTMPKAIALAAIGVWMYSTHQRTLGVLLALCVMILLLWWKRVTEFKHVLCFLGVTGVFFVISQAMKQIITTRVWRYGDESLSFVWKELVAMVLGLVLLCIVEYLRIHVKRRKVIIPARVKSVVLITLGGMALIVIILGIRKILTAEYELSAVDVNDYKGIFSLVQYMLASENGFLNLWQKLWGRLYYVGVATAWLAVWGVIQALRQGFTVFVGPMAKAGKKQSARVSGSYISLFLVLGFLLTVGISALFLITSERQDAIIYGRYTEFIMGPLFLVGLVTLFYTRRNWLPALLTVLTGLLCTWITYRAFAGNENTAFNTNSSLAVVKFFEDGVDGIDQIIPLAWKSMLMFVIGYAISWIPFRFLKKWYSAIFALVIGFLLWQPNIMTMVEELHAAHEVQERRYSELLEDMETSEKPQELYIVGRSWTENIRFAQRLQYAMPHVKIHYLFFEKEDEDIIGRLKENKTAWVIADTRYPDMFELYKDYYYVKDYPWKEIDWQYTWRILVPMESLAAAELKGKGERFYNDTEGLVYTKEDCMSLNAADTMDGTWESDGEMGYLAYGQYATLQPGSYVYEADLTTVSIVGVEAHIDVAIDGDIIGSDYPNMADYLDPDMKIHCEVPFTLEQETSRLEFRVYSSLGIKIRIDGLRVRKVD